MNKALVNIIKELLSCDFFFICVRTYHVYWCSWRGKGRAHAQTHWCGKGWHINLDANSLVIFPTFLHQLTPGELLWTRWLELDLGAIPKNIKFSWNYRVMSEYSFVWVVGTIGHFLHTLSIWYWNEQNSKFHNKNL